jgi:oxygen-independent coproporphyrinogen-3 oxidase
MGQKDRDLSVPFELLKKYDRAGPRYTSYPTVPEWSDDFTGEKYMEALHNASAHYEPLSMYVHVPFCRRRCYFCGCNTYVSSNSQKPDRYLTNVQREIKLVGKALGKRKRLAQLHWGGGTPTFFSLEQIQSLFDAISSNFEFEPGAELAIEVDPRVTTSEQLDLLRSFGFNRISLGVQDFSSEVQAAIGRNQSFEQAKTLFDNSRKIGFSGINIDLVYGLPCQTVEGFQSSIDKVVKLGADRVAVYSYAHLPSLKAHQRKIDESKLPTPEQKYQLFMAAVDHFLKAGYVQIGMDHFAKPDDELALALSKGRLHRNFMGYTTKVTGDSVGVGLSAISEIDGCFAQNHSGLDSYLDSIEKGHPATYRGMRLADDDKIRQWVILSLMCNFQLSFNQLAEKFGIKYSDYFSIEDKDLGIFISDGLLERVNGGLRIPHQGRLFIRNIAMVFDRYLRRKRGDKVPLFSRTI